MKNTIILGTLACLSAGGAFQGLAAQALLFERPAVADQHIPVTVVAASHGETPMVLRRADLEPRNVVMVDLAVTDARQFAEAVVALLLEEAGDQEGAQRSNTAVRRFRLDNQPPALPRAGDVLRHLRVAAERSIEGLGTHRAVEIWVPRLRTLAR